MFYILFYATNIYLTKLKKNKRCDKNEPTFIVFVFSTNTNKTPLKQKILKALFWPMAYLWGSLPYAENKKVLNLTLDIFAFFVHPLEKFLCDCDIFFGDIIFLKKFLIDENPKLYKSNHVKRTISSKFEYKQCFHFF